MTIELSVALAEIYHPTEVNAATYTVLESDKILDVKHTTTAAVNITIPSAFATGQCSPIDITDTGGNAGTNNITLSTEGSEKINGADTAVIESDNASFNLFTDGTNYFLK